MSAAAAAPWCVADKRWEAGQTTRAETHCGCFLPDLTGLARRPSAADLPGLHIMFRDGDKATRRIDVWRRAVTAAHAGCSASSPYPVIIGA